VGFAEELVTCAYVGDRENRGDDLKTLAKRFEKVAPLAQDQLDELLLRSVNEVRDWAKILSVGLRDSHFIGRMLNWNGLADLPDIPDERFSEPPEAAAGSEEVPAEAADALAEKKSIFEQGIDEITLTMTGRYDLNSLILMALETIYRGLGLSRVVFFLNDVKTDQMVARSGFGEGVEDLIQKLRFQPSRGRDYFNQAAWTGKDIILNDTSIPRVQERLPAWYRRISDASMMILYPVMLKNFAAGLFYGDLLNPNCRINKGLLVYVDRLRNLTARAVREKRMSGG
jgi:eukaryotic-like serine/threonine-protein kinase